MKTLTPLLLALLAASASAQHAHGTGSSPYAGQEQRAIKSLSDAEVRDLLAGQGMGFAKAAELNGYPGPAHVLEHADALALTAQQRDATRTLMEQHKARARDLGRELVEAERRLDRAFATRNIDAAALAALSAEIGRRQAELRTEHLRTHLQQTALLSEQQVRQYGQLRGYAGAAGQQHQRPGHGQGHGQGGHR